MNDAILFMVQQFGFPGTSLSDKVLVGKYGLVMEPFCNCRKCPSRQFMYYAQTHCVHKSKLSG